MNSRPNPHKKIIAPKLLALDSSHWSKLIKAASRGNKSDRRTAFRFSETLLEEGYSLLFTFHHLQELAATKDPFLVKERFDFLRNIPFISWIGLSSEPFSLGGIVEILAAEALCAFETDGDATTVRDATRTKLIRSGSGGDIVFDDPYFIDFFCQWAHRRSDHARTITGIAPIQFLKSDMTLGELMSGKMRSKIDTQNMFNQMFGIVTSELQTRGDKRINNASERAAYFMKRSLELREGLSNDPKNLILEGLELQGIDEDDIRPDMKMAEVNELSIFRGQLKAVAPNTGIPFEVLKKRVRMEQLPSQIISRALKANAQDLPERKGSDLNDGYLATLAAYSDILYVDKRTAENFRRAKIKAPYLKEYIGEVRKTGDWKCILNEL